MKLKKYIIYCSWDVCSSVKMNFEIEEENEIEAREAAKKKIRLEYKNEYFIDKIEEVKNEVN